MVRGFGEKGGGQVKSGAPLLGLHRAHMFVVNCSSRVAHLVAAADFSLPAARALRMAIRQQRACVPREPRRP